MKKLLLIFLLFISFYCNAQILYFSAKTVSSKEQFDLFYSKPTSCSISIIINTKTKAIVIYKQQTELYQFYDLKQNPLFDEDMYVRYSFMCKDYRNEVCNIVLLMSEYNINAEIEVIYNNIRWKYQCIAL